jgi:hypothetical protein
MAIARRPTDREQKAAASFLERWSDKKQQAMIELCKLIMNLNEFVYVD